MLSIIVIGNVDVDLLYLTLKRELVGRKTTLRSNFLLIM